MEALENILIAGIPIMTVVVGIVEYAKSLSMPTKYAPALAMALGVAFAVAIELAVIYPELNRWLVAVVVGLALGLSATGLYKASKKFRPPSS